MHGAGSIDLPPYEEGVWAGRCMEESVCVSLWDWEILRCHRSNGEARAASLLTDDLSVERRRGEGKEERWWLDSCANAWPALPQCLSFMEAEAGGGHEGKVVRKTEKRREDISDKKKNGRSKTEMDFLGGNNQLSWHYYTSAHC